MRVVSLETDTPLSIAEVEVNAPDVAAPSVAVDLLSALDDADSDGLLNGIDDIVAGTDVFNPDTDGDGILDGADAQPLAPSPGVVSVDPVDGATNVSIRPVIAVEFSLAVEESTVTGSSMRLEGPGAVVVPATLSVEGAGLRATLTPAEDLAVGASYSVILTDAILALPESGGAPLQPFESTFASRNFPALLKPA